MNEKHDTTDDNEHKKTTQQLQYNNQSSSHAYYIINQGARVRKVLKNGKKITTKKYN